MFLKSLRHTPTLPHILQHPLICLRKLRQKFEHVVELILGNDYDTFERVGEDDVALTDLLAMSLPCIV